MFEVKVFMPDYTYVKNRILIPANSTVKEAYSYITEQLKEQYKDAFLGCYVIWDTCSAADKYDGRTVPFSSGKLDFYLHIYVFKEGRAKPLYAQAQFNYVFADRLAKHVQEADYLLVERSIGAYVQKEVKVLNTSAFLNASLLADVSLGKVYSKAVFKWGTTPRELPLAGSEFDSQSLSQLVATARELNLTDGVELNPLTVITTAETHTMEAFQQAFILAKLVGALRKLNQWTTRMHRSHTKRFKDIWTANYPGEFQAFYSAHTEQVIKVTTLSGGYMPVDSLVSFKRNDDGDLTILLFNPFTSMYLSISDQSISMHFTHKLMYQPLQESLQLLESIAIEKTPSVPA